MQIRSVAVIPGLDVIWIGDDEGCVACFDTVAQELVMTAECSQPENGPINFLLHSHHCRDVSGEQERGSGVLWGGCGQGKVFVLCSTTGETKMVSRPPPLQHSTSLLRSSPARSRTEQQDVSGAEMVDGMLCASISPALRVVLVGSVRGNITAWSTDSYRYVMGVESSDGAITSLVCTTNDGDVGLMADICCVTGHENGKILLWSEELVQLTSFNAHKGSALALSFVGTRIGGNNSCSLLWSGGKDGRLCVWKSSLKRREDHEEEEEVVLELVESIPAHEKAITSLTYQESAMGDGGQVYSTGADSLCVMWDASSFDKLEVTRATAPVIRCVPYSRAIIETLYVCDADGAISIVSNQRQLGFATRLPPTSQPKSPAPSMAHQNENHASMAELQLVLDDTFEQVRAQHLEIKSLNNNLLEAMDENRTLRGVLSTKERKNSSPSPLRCRNDCSMVEQVEQRERSILELSWMEQYMLLKEMFLQVEFATQISCSERKETSEARKELAYVRNLVRNQQGSLRAEVFSNAETATSVTMMEISALERRVQDLTDSVFHERSMVKKMEGTLEQTLEDYEAQLLVERRKLAEVKAVKDAESREIIEKSQRFEVQLCALLEVETADVALDTVKELITEEITTRNLRASLESDLIRLDSELKEAKGTIASYDLEVAELKLREKNLRDAHLRETRQHDEEFLAMKEPWDMMKRTLQSLETALDDSKAQFVDDLSHLERIVAERDQEIAKLKIMTNTNKNRAPSSSSSVSRYR